MYANDFMTRIAKNHFSLFKKDECLEHFQQWSKKLNIDVKLKKISFTSGAIMGAKVLLVNSF